MTKLSVDFAAAQKPTPKEFFRAVLDVLTGKAGNETIQEMLDCGADPDMKSNDGFPMLTLVSDHIDLMQIFLDAGADIDATCAGYTTLMRAAYSGKDETVRFLINGGASLDCRTKDGKTALELVQEQGDNHHLVTMEALLLDAIETRNRAAVPPAEVKPEEKPVPGALIEAVYDRDVEAVKDLLRRGADVNEKGAGGKTPLIQAARIGHTEIAQLLLEEGAVVDDRDGNERSALMWAAALGHADCAREIIKCGADVNVRYNDGFTPLILTASKGFEGMTQLLIDNDACLDAKVLNMSGFTALIMAAAHGHTNIVRQLVDAGANLDLTDGFGFTALASVDQPSGMNGDCGEIIKILETAPEMRRKKQRHAIVAGKQQRLRENVKKLNLRLAP